MCVCVCVCVCEDTGKGQDLLKVAGGTKEKCAFPIALDAIDEISLSFGDKETRRSWEDYSKSTLSLGAGWYWK